MGRPAAVGLMAGVQKIVTDSRQMQRHTGSLECGKDRGVEERGKKNKKAFLKRHNTEKLRFACM